MSDNTTKYEFLGNIRMYCPVCGQKHNVEVRRREKFALMDEKKVCFSSTYLRCCNAPEGEVEFETGEMMAENLQNARTEYRKILSKRD